MFLCLLFILCRTSKGIVETHHIYAIVTKLCASGLYCTTHNWGPEGGKSPAVSQYNIVLICLV